MCFLILHREIPCADLESFFRGGPILIRFFFFFFIVNKGIEDPNSVINGPSSARPAKRH